MKRILVIGLMALVDGVVASEIDLAGQWQLTGEDRNGGSLSCPIAVPGGVHSALLAAGRMCDVFTGANETQTLWVARRDWTVSRTFDVTDDILAAREVVLRLEDCDTFCEVRLNGHLVGETTDRFQRYTFDVKPYLKAGTNTVVGCFKSPVRMADVRRETMKRPYPMSNVQWAKNQALIRKPACHAGWDWGPELEVMGFCGTVKLIASEKPRIDYVYTQQDFNDDLSHCTLGVFADMSDGTTVTNRIEIDNPPLWWPNGAGEQRFYEYGVMVNGEKVKGRIGLRKLEVLNEKTLSKDGKEELSLVFRVNNRRLFMKGANWIPCDAYENRQTPARYRDLLESARAANMNMLRVWGGGQYEKDVFYDLCDELGILLWHDMMCACAVYPGDGVVAEEIAAELKHQLRRLRDHASIALWCGDNECLGAIKWFDETRADLDFYRGEWAKRSKMQDELVRSYDPTRAYWPSSPCCGPGDFGDAWKDDSKGDMHNWTVWHENRPFEAYYDYAPRFCSEFGYQSFPSLEVALTFASREEIESHAPAFEWHQKNPGGNRRIRETMTRYFPAPKDVASELLLSQFQHAMGMKMACDGWRAQRPRCMGTLFWQLNDNWPVASWSSIEYGEKWKPVQHLARRFFAPLSIVGSPEGRIVALNDTAEMVRGEAVIETWSYRGELLASETRAVSLAPDSATRVSIVASTGDSAFLVLRLKTSAGEVVNDWHFARYRDVPLADARIDARVEPTTSKRQFAVTLSASAPAFFVWADVPGVRGEFDDNAFTLVPGRPKTILFTAREPISWWDFKDRLSVVSLSDLVSDTPIPGPAVKTSHEIRDGRPTTRWRGFNLNTLYNRDWNPNADGYDEEDFRMIAELGFNFVRLTLDYRYWIPDGDRRRWTEFDETGLRKIDRALALAEKYNMHVQLALYRLPGYASGGEAEPADLFSDAEALRVAAAHWRMLATRYKGYDNERLTFNLINEPNFMPEAKYAPIVRALVAAIREVDASRYLFADGVDYGRIPSPSLYGLPRLGQSYHAYDPHGVTHYRAPWVDLPQVEPVWPPKAEAAVGPKARPASANAGKDFISRKSFAQWNPALAEGVFVNVGEFGIWKRTPHAVTLALMEDELALFKERNLGWALWEFRGGFGILDSEREDVVYEDYHGHKLDRKMLELLQKY